MKQKIKAILDDDRGVSPVIGVILMVAITVILAAVIGTFVLGLGDSLQQAPQSQVSVSDASATFDDTDNTEAFELSHSGGDAIPSEDMRIVLRDSTGSTVATFSSGSWNGDNLTIDYNGNGDPSGDYQVGDRIAIEATADASSISSGNDYTIQVIHVPSESIIVDQTVTLQ